MRTGMSDLHVGGEAALQRGSVLLVSVLLLFALRTEAAQTKPHRRATGSLVVVDAPMGELADGYLRWLKRHPELVSHDRPQIPAPVEVVPRPREAQEAPVAPLAIQKLPSIYLYSPGGVLIYEGTSPSDNVAFLRALPDSIQQVTQEKTVEVGPSLREMVEMLVELKPYQAALLATKRYTVLAITCTQTAHCKEQNEAIRQLGKHLHQVKIGVVEVRFHP